MSATELDEFTDNDYEIEDQSDEFSLSNGKKFLISILRVK
jgi:hypothetical protein